jgi:hypothetical protein
MSDFDPPGFPVAALFSAAPAEALRALLDADADELVGAEALVDFEIVEGTSKHRALVTYTDMSSDIIWDLMDAAEKLSKEHPETHYAVFFETALVIAFKGGKKVLDHGPDDAKPYTHAEELGLGHLSPAD